MAEPRAIEFLRNDGSVERMSVSQAQRLAARRIIDTDSHVRVLDAEEWSWAVDMEALAPYFRVQQVHTAVPMVLIPVAVLLFVLSLIQIGARLVENVRGGPETYAWLTGGAALCLVVGVCVPLIELGLRAVQVKRLQEGR